MTRTIRQAKRNRPRHKESDYRAKVVRSIETPEDAKRIRDLNITRLGKGHPLREAIEVCSSENPCHRMACTVCAREFRLGFSSNVLSIAETFDRKAIISIHLKRVKAGELNDVWIQKEIDRLRKRLMRAGIVTAIGGIEVSFDAERREWKLHAHLLILNATTAQLTSLEERCRDKGLARAFDQQDVNDPVEQITYLLKFSTGHRPGAGRKPRMFPLPRPALRELVEWWRSYRFDNFVFLLGFRRKFSRIASSSSETFRNTAGSAKSLVRGDVATRQTKLSNLRKRRTD